MRIAYQRLNASALDFPLRFDDIVDSRRLELAVPTEKPPRSRRLVIGFVIIPAGLGSGGHTTIFRMVAALEAAGHRCVILVYDRHGGTTTDHGALIRAGWPFLRAEIRSVDEGIRGFDVCVATAWPTAHVLARHGTEPMRRLYLVQDFEPYFYPHGDEYSLAADTYRFDFRCVTIGGMLARMLKDLTGVDADVVPFGCDEDAYGLDGSAVREGVVFYARPQAPRRGYMLGLAALAELRRLRPDVEIHLVGDPNVTTPFPAHVEGGLAPTELAALFNRCRLGLTLSFTNMTLMAQELLACGTVPVINDLPFAREELESPYVKWVQPTPVAIARSMLDVLERPPDPAKVSATARRGGWTPGQDAFVRAVEREVYRLEDR